MQTCMYLHVQFIIMAKLTTCMHSAAVPLCILKKKSSLHKFSFFITIFVTDWCIYIWMYSRWNFIQSSIFGHWKQLFRSFQTIVFSIYMAIGKRFKRKIKPTHFFKMCYLVADVQHYQEYAIIGVSLTKCYSLETCWQGTWLSPIYRVPGAKITPHEWFHLSMRWWGEEKVFYCHCTW